MDSIPNQTAEDNSNSQGTATLETILYRNHLVPVELISEINIAVREQGEKREGNDTLYRDEDGHYYLFRETHAGRFCLLQARENPDAHEYRSRVHRISLVAAILWAIRQLGNGNPWNLYVEASELLTADPATGTNTQRFADGSMAVTVPFGPEPARLLRAASELDDDTPLGLIYEATHQYVSGMLSRGRDAEIEMDEVFRDNLPDEDSEPHPDTAKIAELTAANAALLRELFSLQKFANEVVARYDAILAGKGVPA